MGRRPAHAPAGRPGRAVHGALDYLHRALRATRRKRSAQVCSDVRLAPVTSHPLRPRALLLPLVLATGCADPARSAASRPPGGDVPVAEVVAELEAMSGPLTATQRDTFASVLQGTLEKDAWSCHPSPRQVFAGADAEGDRLVMGTMPHYGFFFGPMQYLVQRRAGRWRVEARIAVEPPRGAASLELPDCKLREALEGSVTCSGQAYAESDSTEACPASGSFSAPATPRNVTALLRRWSEDAEAYWNRDAQRFGVPVTYDFDFVRLDEARARGLRVDMALPLAPTCGRTPYFSAFRSGWSLPVVAHEVGHLLGLLDEYEAFSGIVGFYPKTPFPGAEVSRMGLSMREKTQLLPMHHYLVLRRWYCRAPASRDPYRHAAP